MSANKIHYIIKSLHILITVLLFLANFDSIGQNNDKQVLELLEEKMEEHSIPGLQIVIIKNNKIILSESLGLSNVQFSIKTDKKTIFSINSIAKIFASTAILQLAEKGKLQIEQLISKYLNDLPLNWQNITIKQLLSHTSGLPDIENANSGDLIGGKGMVTAWVEVQKLPLQFKAGEEFSYNATNYLLLQKIIEKLCGMSFEKFVKQNQFKVASMSKTFYGNSSLVKQNKSPTYSFYYFDKELGDYTMGEELLEVYEEFPIKADAGVFSNAEEVAKWIIALQKGRLLTKQAIDKMWKPIKLNNGKYGGFGDLLNAYALGWPVIEREKHKGCK